MATNDWSERVGIYKRKAVLRLAFRMALHLIADRPAPFSGLNLEAVRDGLANKILADAAGGGQRDPVKLSTAAVRSVERAIGRLSAAVS